MKRKTCYCLTCGKAFHPLGIARHRLMHKDKHEDCVIRYASGTYRHPFSRQTTELADFRQKSADAEAASATMQ